MEGLNEILNTVGVNKAMLEKKKIKVTLQICVIIASYITDLCNYSNIIKLYEFIQGTCISSGEKINRKSTILHECSNLLRKKHKIQGFAEPLTC